MRTPNIICFANQKGGVAKSTSCIITASALMKEGFDVLVFDLDAQANTTSAMNIHQLPIAKTICEALHGTADVNDCIIETPMGHLIPGSRDLSTAGNEFTSVGKEHMIEELIARIHGDYDYILLDTPSELGWATINALTASEWVVMPSSPDYWANNAIKDFQETFDMIKRYTNPGIEIAGVLTTCLEENTVNSRVNMELARLAVEAFDIPMFSTRIHKSTNVRDAITNGKDVLVSYPRCRAAMDYRAFAKELIEKVPPRLPAEIESISCQNELKAA